VKRTTVNMVSGYYNKGFTLVELMITVVVIAILAMIAVPAYNDSVKKARRTDGKSSLTAAASRQEQYFLDNKTYASTMSQMGSSSSSIDGHYTLAVATPTAGCPIATCFELQANPIDEDKQCQKLTLTSTGVRGVTTGTAAPTNTAENCW